MIARILIALLATATPLVGSPGTAAAAGATLPEREPAATAETAPGATDGPVEEAGRSFRGRALVVAPGGAGPVRHDLELSDRGGRVEIAGATAGELLELELTRGEARAGAPAALTLTGRRSTGGGGPEPVVVVATDPGATRLAFDLGWLSVELVATGPTSADLDLLADWLAGSFASTAQAAADPEYLDIRLRMAPIWADREDGRWLYVEQAVADYRDRPYRQRVYRLREVAPGLFESETYTLPDPEAAVGAWRQEAPLADLGPGRLEPRSGCSILLRREGDAFVGGTLGRLCPSERRGADFATSEVRVTAAGMTSWDRGFAADGSQVWGAVSGGYVFDRVGGAADPDPEPVVAPEPAAPPPPSPAPADAAAATP